jgi:hypothetical protein
VIVILLPTTDIGYFTARFDCLVIVEFILQL